MSIRPTTRQRSSSRSCWASSCRPRISSWHVRPEPSHLRSCSVLSRQTQLLSKGSWAFRKGRSRLRMSQPSVSGSARERGTQMAAIIEVERLTKSYGNKRGIADVSFAVEEGEVFGFLGPNGAGKTTTIRVLMALLRADAGSARIAGLDCWEQSVEIKRLIGYLPGELALDPGLTGGQILDYFGHLRGGVDHAYVTQLTKRFDLDPTRKFRQYSSGNKRKVGLIQAFMHRPRLLILDEPTSGLDPLNQQEFDRLVF